MATRTYQDNEGPVSIQQQSVYDVVDEGSPEILSTHLTRQEAWRAAQLLNRGLGGHRGGIDIAYVIERRA